MLDQEPVDITRLVSPPGIERRWTETRLPSSQQQAEPRQNGSVSLWGAQTQLSRPSAQHPGTGAAISPPTTTLIVTTTAPLDQARDDRVRLLAKKYATGQVNREEFARIEILTARLETLAPRTTRDDVDRLAAAVAAIERLDADLRDFDAEFGEQ